MHSSSTRSTEGDHSRTTQIRSEMGSHSSGQRNVGDDRACEEKHYSVTELAELWNLSKQTIRRIFQDEEGVVRIGEPGSTRKRSYMTLRIPDSVVRRVHMRLRKSA